MVANLQALGIFCVSSVRPRQNSRNGKTAVQVREPTCAESSPISPAWGATSLIARSDSPPLNQLAHRDRFHGFRSADFCLRQSSGSRVRACSLSTFFADRAAGRRCWAGLSGALARGARPAAALARANGGLLQPTRPDANGWTRPSAVLSSGLQARYAQSRIGPPRSPACGFPVCAAQPLF